MKKVIRVVSALGAGASLIWGIARTLRRKKGSTDDGGPEWPPKNAEAAARGPAPTPTPAKAEPAKAAPEPEPAAAEAPVAEAPAKDGPVVVKGVQFDDPAAVVAFVNGADEAALTEAGVKGKAQKLVLDTAPITSVEGLAVPGIGRRTLQSLAGVVEK